MTIIQITPEGYIVLSGDAPEQGRKYSLEDTETGTAAQNKAFHALCQEFYVSGCHSYNCASWLELKEYIKRDLGAGFASFVYADETGMHEVKTQSDIPAGTPSTHMRGKLKSWADYSKKERRETMDNLISTMIQAGVKSRKFDEILGGMA